MLVLKTIITFGTAALCVTAAALPITSLDLRSVAVPDRDLQDQYRQLVQTNGDNEKKKEDIGVNHGKRQAPQDNWDPCISGLKAMCIRMQDLGIEISLWCYHCKYIDQGIEKEREKWPPPVNMVVGEHFALGQQLEGLKTAPSKTEGAKTETADCMVEEEELQIASVTHDPDKKCHVKELKKCWKKIDKGKFPLPDYCKDCRFSPDGRRLPRPCRTDPDNFNKCVDTKGLPDEDEEDEDDDD